MDRDLQAGVLTAIFWSGVVLTLVRVFVPDVFPFLLALFLYLFGIFFVGILLVITVSFSFRIFKRLISTLNDFFSNARSHH